jgi:hypothetical protein
MPKGTPSTSLGARQTITPRSGGILAGLTLHPSASNGSIPIRLPCPDCGKLHLDEGKWATKPHHTHACQFCGAVWRPAVVNTVGVRFLPGFKNDEPLIDPDKERLVDEIQNQTTEFRLGGYE